MLLRRGVGRVGRPGLIGTVARTAVVAGTATAVAGGVQRRQQNRQVQAEQSAAYQQEQQPAAQPQPQPQPAAAAPAPGGNGPDMAQLQQLVEMRNQGLLDEAEFAAAKSRLLGL